MVYSEAEPSVSFDRVCRGKVCMLSFFTSRAGLVILFVEVDLFFQDLWLS